MTIMRIPRQGPVAIALLLAAAAGCSRSPAAKSARFIEAGKKQLERHDTARAILQFRNAVQAMPRNAEAHYQLGLAYLAARDIASAAASLRQALQIDPSHAGAQVRLASLMSGGRDPGMLRDAQQRLKTVLAGEPQNADALHALALTELKLGEPAGAVAHLEDAVRIAPRELSYGITLALAKITQGDVSGAEAVLKAACASAPASSVPLVVLGRFYAGLRRTSEAEQQFYKALALKPSDPAALYNLAALEYHSGRRADAERHFRQLSALPDGTVNYLLGVFLLEAGRNEEAVREFERLYRANPADRMSRTRLITANLTAGRLAAAEAVLDEALRKNKRDIEALLQRGELFVGAGKLSRAEEDFNQVFRMQPDSPELHFARASLYAKSGKVPLQKHELSEALRFNANLLAARIALARVLLQENAAQAALDLLDAAPPPQKNLPAVIEQRNWALLAMGKRGEVRQAVDRALAAVRTPDLLLQDAILKIGEGRNAEARESLHEAMKMSPNDLRLLQVLVRSYPPTQRSVGVDEVRAYAAQQPKSAPVLYFLGRLLSETGDRDAAKQALAASLAVSPDFLQAQLWLARIDLTQGNWDEGRRELNRVLAASPEDQQAHLWLGMLETSVGNDSAAISEFSKVVERQPDNAVALNNLAYLLVEHGDQGEKPLQFAQRAAELEPENLSFADTLGWVFYRRGLYTLSLPHLQKAAGKQSSAVAQYHLGMALIAAGQPDRGRTALTAAMRLNPNPSVKAEIERILNAR